MSDNTHQAPFVEIVQDTEECTPPGSKWRHYKPTGRRFWVDGVEVSKDEAMAAYEVAQLVKASA